jgi:hypothetical protein
MNTDKAFAQMKRTFIGSDKRPGKNRRACVTSHIGALLGRVRDAVLAVTGSAPPNCRLAHPSPELCRFYSECFPNSILSLIPGVLHFRLSAL